MASFIAYTRTSHLEMVIAPAYCIDLHLQKWNMWWRKERGKGPDTWEKRIHGSAKSGA